MNERRSLRRWIREHKKELIAAGVGIGALLAAIWAIKHKDQLKVIWNQLRDLIHSPAQDLTDKLPELVKEPAAFVPADTESAAQVIEIAVAVPPAPTQDLPKVIPLSPSLVNEHLRTLHEGWHHSPAKFAEALAKGIVLRENQTLVDAYLKGGVA